VVLVGSIRPYFSPKAVISCSSFSPSKKTMPATTDPFLPASLRLSLRVFVGLFIAFITWVSLRSPSTEIATFPHFDKLAHAGVYGVLAFTASLAWPAISKPRIFMGCLLYGGAMEVAQGTLTSSRMPSILDFVANGFGAAMALCILGWAIQKFAR